ncbi:MAG: dihydropteroate synthase [Chitinophagales bacterium]
MGILNVTPDSFYDGGKNIKPADALLHTEQMLKAGADIIDVGGMSTRPGAETVSADLEMMRIIPVLQEIKKQFPECWVSVDTVHARTAQAAIDCGADIINDISAGAMDNGMTEVIANTKVPYIIMHMQGTPQTMQQAPQYDKVMESVFSFFIEKLTLLKEKGVHDVIIDPGFGFGKTVEHNYQLAANLQQFTLLGKPVLVGISRKSMICKLLKVHPENALNGSTALHALLLLQGADILRVHDVKEAKEVVQIVNALALHKDTSASE